MTFGFQFMKKGKGGKSGEGRRKSVTVDAVMLIMSDDYGTGKGLVEGTRRGRRVQETKWKQLH